ncbi:MAG: hypothetical protein KL839_08495 [Rhizobium sp.]|nr:hypothetical protein [Rhizobium sp.]
MTSPVSPPPDASRIDAQNRHIAQEAGLDQDLESQVPPRYGAFTVTTLGVILVLMVAAIIWIII